MSQPPIPKRLRKIVRAATAAGWAYDTTTAGHPRLSPPRGMMDPRQPDQLQAPITFAKTGSDVRGDRNAVAALRRSGIDL